MKKRAETKTEGKFSNVKHYGMKPMEKSKYPRYKWRVKSLLVKIEKCKREYDDYGRKIGKYETSVGILKRSVEDYSRQHHKLKMEAGAIRKGSHRKLYGIGEAERLEDKAEEYGRYAGGARLKSLYQGGIIRDYKEYRKGIIGTLKGLHGKLQGVIHEMHEKTKMENPDLTDKEASVIVKHQLMRKYGIQLDEKKDLIKETARLFS